jgi:hypothetical protein
MKWIGVALGLFLFWRPISVLADEASKNAKIEEMMQVTYADRMFKQTFDQIKTMQMAQLNKMEVPAGERQAAEEIQQKTMALLSDRMSWDKLKPALVKVYSETYTEEEINGIVAFYKSQAGQAMLEKSPLLMQRVMAMSQELVGDLTPEIKRITEDVKQKSKK